MSKYPECKKLAKVREESNAIVEFLDWLVNERDILLCEVGKTTDADFEDDYYYYPINLSIRNLLGEYFDIDMDKVEKERQEILKELKTND